MNAYLVLTGAILFEVIGTLLLPISKSFTKLVPTLLLLLSYGFSFYLLSLASQQLPLAIIYVSWAGMGVFLITIFSFIFYNQLYNWQTIFGLCLIVLGVSIVNVFKA